MSAPRLLDLFCKAGGAARGYQRAGFYVVGVDIEPQPRYAGDEFVQADALTFPLDGFDAIHASPPCQAYSSTQRIRSNTHPDLIGETRTRLARLGVPFVIENVVGAPLLYPIELCGAMFGLRTYRHRLFESNVVLGIPPHPTHLAPTRKMGRAPAAGDFMHIVGNFSGAAMAREIMECPWMTRDELREAVPPAYAEWIGRQLIAFVSADAAISSSRLRSMRQ